MASHTIRYRSEGPWGTATVYKLDMSQSSSVLVGQAQSKTRSLLNQYIGTSALSQQVLSLESSSLGSLKDKDTQSDHAGQGGLSLLLSCLFGSVLEDAMAQMLLLGQCNNELKIIKTYADHTQLTAVKYGVSMPVVSDDLNAIDTNELNSTIYKIAKLDSDRKYVTELMKNIYIELALRRSFHILTENMQVILDRAIYKHNLEVDETRNKLIRKDLIRQVRHQRNRFKSVIYETDVKINDLSAQVEDSSLCSATASRYVGNWEVARTEQHLQTINDTEKPPIDSITFHKTSFDQEVRVHTEVELLVNIAINETLAKIEDWMAKYDADSEKLDIKIQLKKNDYQDMVAKRKEMEETLKRHAEQMKDWVHFKDEREKARQYHEKMTNAAISVQCWWRGLLVRLQLGPYKPKKPAKGAGKGKK